MAFCLEQSLLKSVDLPTLGRPTMAILKCFFFADDFKSVSGSILLSLLFAFPRSKSERLSFKAYLNLKNFVMVWTFFLNNHIMRNDFVEGLGFFLKLGFIVSINV